MGSCKALFERKKESIVRFVSCLFGVAVFAIVLSKVLQELKEFVSRDKEREKEVKVGMSTY